MSERAVDELTYPLAQHEDSSLLNALSGSLGYLSTLYLVADLHQPTARSCIVLVKSAGKYSLPTSRMRKKDLVHWLILRLCSNISSRIDRKKIG